MQSDDNKTVKQQSRLTPLQEEVLAMLRSMGNRFNCSQVIAKLTTA